MELEILWAMKMNTQLEILQLSRGVEDSFLQWFILTVCDCSSLKIMSMQDNKK